MRGMKRMSSIGLFALALAVSTLGVFCAEVDAWQPGDDDMLGDGGPKGDADGMAWTCYRGTPTNEPELLDRCTEAERVVRPSNIPPKP